MVNYKRIRAHRRRAMPKKIYIVDLTKEQRAYLLDFIKSGER